MSTKLHKQWSKSPGNSIINNSSRTVFRQIT